ncbi:MAG TPA: hypothetical protein VE465_27210 [Streptosporangiaceae bacterium]|jgi:hypothetical protein|nr:hypothetical protein [Streptosporangiaceae bacterium]
MSTLETIKFQLRDGVVESQFLQLNRQVEDQFMARRPGFRSRQTARGKDGEWFVSVQWATSADADATGAAFFGAPETQDFLAVIDATTVSHGYYELVDY